ncbi:molybdate ABC transporter substrate-binding protein [Pararhodospirillum oryzae]|uniref:Molybdate ABC transporter substrate-binding protein n=1 Tax=Pararhodospirillum oryzae TaxID=478448 RepID=A0A512H3Y4_9PROT|nr:molybdate ABC transporter substrate-binding protein [Pararhodospirillum oryzae]GEO80176.1 molybdate ABC transporter substrate-binding protein [Pararhodospirillum oryzae]
MFGSSVRFSRRAALIAPLALVLGLALTPQAARAGETVVAVAANFTAAAKDIGEAFTKETGHTVKYSFGATGQLYTQITQGAPFEVFLAADDERPAKAETEGLAVPDTRFTYAVGTLVLWSTDPALIDDQGEVLKKGTFEKIAIANPATAPYGAAALETMKAMGVFESLEPKIVQGNNISQTQQFVASGSAALGFVALSQVIDDPAGSRWVIPQEMYTPIKQDAVLLKTGEASEAAKAYVEFLKSPAALEIIKRYGYGVGTPS